MLSSKGDHQAAVAELSSHVAQNPNAIAERRLLIRVLALAGRLGAAREQAAALAGLLGSGSPVPYLELGHAYELAHRYEQALEMYDRAADVAPEDPSGPRTGGLRAARWGEVDLAAPRLAEALRRNPRDADVWHALGLVRTQRRDRAGARQAYLSGLAADPSNLTNRIGLATLALMEERPEEALEQYDRILAARPDLADAHLGRSWALIQLGRIDGARAALHEARRAGADPEAVRRQQALLETLR